MKQKKQKKISYNLPHCTESKVRSHKLTTRTRRNLFFYIMLPLSGIALTATILNFVQNFTVAVDVSYNDQSIGYVKSRDVADVATQIVESKLVLTDKNTEVEIKPTFTAKIVSNQEIIDEEELAEAIIDGADELKTAQGIYVDGVLCAAAESNEQATQVLDTILEEYKPEDTAATADFVNDIDIVEGVFLTEAVSPEPELETILHTENVLDVSVTEKETYTQAIPFTTERIESDSYPIGVEKVIETGADGVEEVTASVTTLKGEELSREIIESKVVTEPIAKKVMVGTAEINLDGAQSGFIWPIEHHMTTSGYGARWGTTHKGLDICYSDGQTNGRPIRAAAGGIVSAVLPTPKSGGYGNLVKIDHGNGIETWYAHNTSISVSEGQIVAQGEELALAGSTGYSTGPHCHFEVRVDGVAQNPMNYLP